MSYTRYDRDIRELQGVMIEGWPAEVEFCPPSKMKKSVDVKRLYDAWKGGETRWRVMSSGEKKALKQQQAGVEPAPRAKRSDAGGTHRKRKGQVDRDDEEDAPQESRAPRAKRSNAGSTRRKRKGRVDRDDEEDAPQESHAPRAKHSDTRSTLGKRKRQVDSKRKPQDDSDDSDDDEDCARKEPHTLKTKPSNSRGSLRKRKGRVDSDNEDDEDYAPEKPHTSRKDASDARGALRKRKPHTDAADAADDLDVPEVEDTRRVGPPRGAKQLQLKKSNGNNPMVKDLASSDAASSSNMKRKSGPAQEEALPVKKKVKTLPLDKGQAGPKKGRKEKGKAAKKISKKLVPSVTTAALVHAPSHSPVRVPPAVPRTTKTWTSRTIVRGNEKDEEEFDELDE